jgi:hypothetical protein
MLAGGTLAGGGLAWAADTSYAVKLDVSSAKRGQKSLAKLLISPGTGYHMNKDYPMHVTVVVPAGLVVDKASQTAKDAIRLEEAGAEFDFSFTPAEVGQKTVTGEVKFAVCSASSCDPKKEKLSFVIDVK